MILIKRLDMYRDRFRNYKIYIDNKFIAIIKNNEEIKIDVPSGEHSVEIKISWCGSNKLSFTAKENEEIKFLCTNIADMSKPFKALFQDRKKYLEIYKI